MVRPIGGAGQRRRPTQRKGRPVVDLDAIAMAALDEIAVSGVRGTTVVAVATRLGVTSRALYHYIGNRQGMFRTVSAFWAKNAPTIPHGGHWRADLEQYIAATVAYLAKHPSITDIGMVEGVVVYSDEFFSNQEANLARLVEMGLAERDALLVLVELVRFTDGLARYYGAPDSAAWAADAVMAGGVEHLEHLDGRYPLSQRAGFIPASEQIVFATQVFLDGIEDHLRRASRTTSQSR